MNLVLTVGTNPLPVFAAGKYLRGRFGNSARVTYLHSQQTTEEAERIESVLQTGGDYKSVHPFDPQKCERDLRAMLAAVSGDVHLHYTGGTKCMGVETALYLSKHCTVELSYLDASTQALNRGDETVDDLRRYVTLGLYELARLHGAAPPQTQSGVPAEDDPLWAGLEDQPVRPRLKISHDGQLVYLIYGYHLLLVSDQRTAMKAGEAKQSGFEAFLRARKWGGDEARVLLVVPFALVERDGRSTDKDVRDQFPQHPEEQGRINGTPVFVWTTADGECFSKKWAHLFEALRWFSY